MKLELRSTLNRSHQCTALMEAFRSARLCCGLRIYFLTRTIKNLQTFTDANDRVSLVQTEHLLTWKTGRQLAASPGVAPVRGVRFTGPHLRCLF